MRRINTSKRQKNWSHIFSEDKIYFRTRSAGRDTGKADPTIVYDILAKAPVEADEVLYVGDSGVDMQTAAAARVLSVGVAWGFRSREELECAGAGYLVDSPYEILDIYERG